MKWIAWVILLSITTTTTAQIDLIAVVKQINPPLFIKSMHGEKIYTPYVEKEAVSFVRDFDFDNRSTEDIQQIYWYKYLCLREKNYVLEFKLDKRQLPALPTDSILRFPIQYSDFGIQIYTLEDNAWKLATRDILPADFNNKITTTFPQVQRSNNFYFYNLNMFELVEISYHRHHIHLMQNKKTILKLAWRKNKFHWK